MLGDFLSFVWRVIVWIAKGFFYFMLYTLPLQLVVAAFFLGGLAGKAAAGDKYRVFFQQESAALTHSVIIQWDDSDRTIIKVREDLDWTINGSDLNQDLYADSRVNSAPSISRDMKGNKTFAGLYTAPNGGGTQFINANGYSIKTVTQDLTLYPYWE